MQNFIHGKTLGYLVKHAGTYSLQTEMPMTYMYLKHTGMINVKCKIMVTFGGRGVFFPQESHQCS